MIHSLAGVDLGAFLAEAALVAFGLASSSNSESSSLATGESSKSEESDMVTAVIATDEVRFKFTEHSWQRVNLLLQWRQLGASPLVHSAKEPLAAGPLTSGTDAGGGYAARRGLGR